jgi:hypothetical protein
MGIEKRFFLVFAVADVLAFSVPRPSLRPAAPLQPSLRPLAPHRPSSLRPVATLRMMSGDDDVPAQEMLAYWQAHEAKWQTPLRMLDVCAAWGCGELDGVLPSGKASRTEIERFLTLARALELFEEGKVDVRRRYRNLRVDELRPRWDRVVATRAKLRADNSWDKVIAESDKARRFDLAQVRGEVEDEDASPAISRAVATLLSPALKAAASQRSRADGGVRRAYAELCEAAGEDAAERWLTAALLAELEQEAASLPSVSSRNEADGASSSSPSSSSSKFDFAARETERDLEQAEFSGYFGVGLALVAGLLWIVDWGAVFSSPGPGDFAWTPYDMRSGMEKALDLMQ